MASGAGNPNAASISGDSRRIRMTLNAKEFDEVPRQQFRIGGTMRRMTRLAAFRFDRRVLKHEWPLFIRVTLDAGDITIDRIAQRFRHKTAVLIVTIGTFHSAFRNFVVKWFGKGRLLLGVALIAHIRLGVLEQKLRAFRRMR